MLLLAAAAALRPRAVGLRPWLRVAGRWQGLLLAESRPAATPGPSSSSASSWRSPRTAVTWPGNLGSLARTAEKMQIPFGRVESLCCFSTSPDHSEYGRLIYTGNLAKAVAGVKFFSYSTSIINIFLVGSMLLRSGVGINSLPLQIAFFTVVGLFTFVTPVVLHFFTKGYVIRLYHNTETDTYTAFTYDAILAEKKTVFHQKEVEIPDVSKLLTTFYVNSKSLFVNSLLFKVPQDFNHLMGYDRSFIFEKELRRTSSRNK